MNRTKNLQGSCTECGGTLTFPAEQIGTTSRCPLCGKETELHLDVPEDAPTIPRRTLIWTGVAILVLITGLFGAYLALKRSQRLVDSLKQNPPSQGTRP